MSEQALVIDRELGDKRSEGNNLSNLGIAYDVLGDNHKAADCVEKAFAIARELGDKELEGWILEDRGDTARKLGDMETDRGIFGEALKIYEEIGLRKAGKLRKKIAELNRE